MTAPLVAPYVSTYAARVPYLTVDEYLAAPTGVDPSALIPGGATAANKAALLTVIRRASRYADSLCDQILAATLDLQVGEYRIWRDSTIRVKLDYSPLVEVVDVKVGTVAGQLTSLPDLSGIWPERKVIRVPVDGLTIPSTLTAGARAARGRLFARTQYVNGYANTTLAGSVIAGASSVTVASPYGVFPNLPMRLVADDLAQTEDVVVASNYTQGSTTVPLATPLVYPHSTGQAISALPGDVKQAVVALATHLIKTRGAEAMSLANVSGGPTKMQQEDAGYSEEYEQAVDLLHPFRRVA